MFRLLAPLMLCLIFAPPPALADAAQDRAEIQTMKSKALARLYKEHPSAKGKVESAYGTAVFSSGGVNVIFFSAAYGSGVAHNNMTGKDTYMKMASGGVGLGAGVKDYRLIFVFHTKEAFDRFVTEGWDLSGQADAAAKAGTDGGEISEAGTVVRGATIYQLTENGLALQATIQGTKYWADSDLN
ncbi:MAG: YSC84-related protein [Pseudomonadota bacterium]